MKMSEFLTLWKSKLIFFSISNGILYHRFTHLPLQVAQKCSRVPHLFIVLVKSKWSKRVFVRCAVHPLLVFAIYRSVKLCANTNIKVATQRSHLGRSKMQRWTFVDFHLNSWNNFCQTSFLAQSFFSADFKSEIPDDGFSVNIRFFVERRKIDTNCADCCFLSIHFSPSIYSVQKKMRKESCLRLNLTFSSFVGLEHYEHSFIFHIFSFAFDFR